VCLFLSLPMDRLIYRRPQRRFSRLRSRVSCAAARSGPPLIFVGRPSAPYWSGSKDGRFSDGYRFTNCAVRTVVGIRRPPRSRYANSAASAPSIGRTSNRTGVGRRSGWWRNDKPPACVAINTPLMGCDLLRFSCALCGSPAQANPTLVMTIPARSDRIERLPTQDAKREPICESCTRQLLGRFERERLPIPSMAREPDYFERAYHDGADEQDL
jgi:hypothetical protein